VCSRHPASSVRHVLQFGNSFTSARPSRSSAAHEADHREADRAACHFLLGIFCDLAAGIIGPQWGTAQMFERRKHERPALNEPAQIVFDEPDSTMDCTIRDLSDDGACVEVANILLIPTLFKLVLSSGATRFCRVAWRTPNRIGVRFG
jgi:PilZ domain